MSSAAVASAKYEFPEPGKQLLTYPRWSNPAVVHAASCLGAALVVTIVWPLAQQESHALVFCILFGILGGALFGLPASGVAFILPKELGDSLGAWTGIMWALSSVFALVGPPIVGQLVRQYTIEAVAYWTGVNLMVAGMLIAVAIWMKHRKDQSERRIDFELGMRTIGSIA